MDLRAILFDFGDTLVHTEAFDYDACLRKMHQSLAQNGIVVPYDDFKRAYFEVRDRFYRDMDKTLEEQDFAERIVQTLKSFGIRLAPKEKRIQEAIKVFMDSFVDSLRIDDYLPALLEKLHKKYKLAVVSNMSFAEAAYQGLRRFDIAKYFDAIIISGIVGFRKPGPKIFQEALKALNVRADETVCVGDSPKSDIQGAKQLGMKTVLLTEKNNKIPSTETFRFYLDQGVRTANPDKEIRELAQLPQALGSLAKQMRPIG